MKKEIPIMIRFTNRNHRPMALFDLYEAIILWLWRTPNTRDFTTNQRLIQNFNQQLFPYPMWDLYGELRSNQRRKVNFIGELFKFGKTFAWMYSNQVDLYLKDVNVQRYVNNGSPD